jgi:hypothetical protein
MRFFFLAALLLPLAASAKPQYPAPGSFFYQGDFQVEIKKRYETVVGFTQEGAARLEKLWAEGYTCANTGRQIYLCSAFEKTEGTETEVASRVHARLHGTKIEIAARQADPELVAKGESYEEWKVQQPITFRGKTYPYYRYMILKNGAELHKIALGEPAEDGFVVDPSGKWINYFSESITESRFVYRNYLIGGDFLRM